MSVEELEAQVLTLSLAERRVFTRWFDEHRDEIVEPYVLVRGQENAADSAQPMPLAEVRAKQLFKEIMDRRAAEKSSRRH